MPFSPLQQQVEYLPSHACQRPSRPRPTTVFSITGSLPRHAAIVLFVHGLLDVAVSLLRLVRLQRLLEKNQHGIEASCFKEASSTAIRCWLVPRYKHRVEQLKLKQQSRCLLPLAGA